MSLYAQLRDAGVALDNHASDLYVKVCPDSTRIIRQALAEGTLRSRPSIFRSQIDGKCWYDIAFMYEPFWESVARKAVRA